MKVVSIVNYNFVLNKCIIYHTFTSKRRKTYVILVAEKNKAVFFNKYPISIRTVDKKARVIVLLGKLKNHEGSQNTQLKQNYGIFLFILSNIILDVKYSCNNQNVKFTVSRLSYRF